MPLIKRSYGSQIATDTVVSKRKCGWKTVHYASINTSLSVITNHLMYYDSFKKEAYRSEDIAAFLNDILHVPSGLLRVFKEPMELSYSRALSTWSSMSKDHGKNKESKAAVVRGMLLLAFLKQGNILKATDNFKIATSDSSFLAVPSIDVILAHVALSNIKTFFATQFMYYAEELAKSRSKAGQITTESIAFYFTEMWDKVCEEYDREKEDVLTYSQHLLYLVSDLLWKENFKPKVASIDQVKDALRLSNLVHHAWVDLEYVPTRDYNEHWAISTLNSIYKSLASKDSELELISSEEFINSVIEVKDFSYKTENRDSFLRSISGKFPTKFDVPILKRRLQRSGASRFSVVSELQGKVEGLVESVLKILDPTSVRNFDLTLVEGSYKQFEYSPKTFSQLEQLVTYGIFLGSILSSSEVVLKHGNSPEFRFIPNANTYKKMYGVDMSRGLQRKTLSMVKAFAATRSSSSSDSNLIKHQTPFYNVEPDEDYAHNPEIITVPNSIELTLLDSTGADIVKITKINRMVDVRCDEDYCIGVNESLNSYISYINKTWNMALNDAPNHRALFRKILVDFIKLSGAQFRDFVTSVTTRNTNFIPMEDASTKESRIYQTTSELGTLIAFISSINKTLSSTIEGIITQALSDYPMDEIID